MSTLKTGSAGPGEPQLAAAQQLDAARQLAAVATAGCCVAAGGRWIPWILTAGFFMDWLLSFKYTGCWIFLWDWLLNCFWPGPAAEFSVGLLETKELVAGKAAAATAVLLQGTEGGWQGGKKNKLAAGPAGCWLVGWLPAVAADCWPAATGHFSGAGSHSGSHWKMRFVFQIKVQ